MSHETGVMTAAVLDVRVTTDLSGGLRVEWDVNGGPMAVDIAVGTSPDGIDHQHAVTAPIGATFVDLPAGDASGRQFVSVSPHGGGSAVIAAERRVAFGGLTNFRDLGGYPTANGGRIRWGKVFRAEALHGLTSDDLDAYRDLGIITVYDLRRDTERLERPNPVPSEQLVFLSDSGDRSPLSASAQATAEDGERILGQIYVGILEHSAVQIGALIGGLADPERLPAVFHCHAGKDRTGVAAALLLEALGVEREVVLDDYELTARYRWREHQAETFDRLLALGLPPEAAAGVLATPRWAMQEALDALARDHGGIERYLIERAGVAPDQLEALRAILVVAEGPRRVGRSRLR